jgi:hypothetical protein
MGEGISQSLEVVDVPSYTWQRVDYVDYRLILSEIVEEDRFQ